MKARTKLLLTLTAVAALSFAHPAKANLITNPGFETGDFTGWTHVGGPTVGGTVDGVAPHSGNFQAVLPIDGGGGSLSQFVATTPGASYTITFFLASSLGPSIATFSALFGGVTLDQSTFAGSFGYTEETFTVTASTASTELLFNYAIGGLPGSALFLDDVSVTPAGVPDAGSTVSLLGCALLGLAALRRFLMG